MPSRPSDYPEECIPRTPDDVFYEDEEEKEGGIYEKIMEYGEEYGIEYSDEQIARFKAYVDAYVAYLKALQAFEGSSDGLVALPFAQLYVQQPVCPHLQ